MGTEWVLVFMPVMSVLEKGVVSFVVYGRIAMISSGLALFRRIDMPPIGQQSISGILVKKYGFET